MVCATLHLYIPTHPIYVCAALPLPWRQPKGDSHGPEFSPSEIHIFLHMYTNQFFSVPSRSPSHPAVCWWKVHFVLQRSFKAIPRPYFTMFFSWLYRPKCELFLILAAPFLPAAKLFPLHFTLSVVPPSLSACCQEQ